MSNVLRAQLVADLTKDLLGPRSVADEVIPEKLDPRQEFQVGQLYPKVSAVERNPDSDAEIPGNSTVDNDDADDADDATSTVVSLGQNFRRNPTSLGITFSLKQDCNLKICTTWARYKKQEAVGWVRSPKLFVVNSDAGAGENEDLPSDNNEIRIIVKRFGTDINKIRVSIYAASLINLSPESRVSTEDLIFQPEIRVLVEDPSLIVGMAEGGFSSSDGEWRTSMRQYDNRPVLARGHLCGAYWKEIDPQQNKPIEFDEIPFVWKDGLYFLEKGNESVREFMEPTLRTDFLPMYSASSPEYGLEGLALNAEDLSNANNKSDLKKLIEPFLTAYQEWIDKQRENYSDSLDKEIIEKHEIALKRMTDGLSFLIDNKNARLAFNFMNKAMNLQTQWAKGGQNLIWRPFQLGFILLTLKSSVLKNDPDREIADVLWFPTGGGKSEAYLGLAAFVSGFRRLASPKDEDGDSTGEGTAIFSRYTLRLLTIQQFRRALRVLTAMEFLRSQNPSKKGGGWLPSGVEINGWVWGRSPFSIGLWVGSRVTPNDIKGGKAYKNYSGGGALYALKNLPAKGESDPAQVLNCPCCNSILAIPVKGLSKGDHTIHLFLYERLNATNTPEHKKQMSSNRVTVNDFFQVKHQSGRIHIVTFNISLNNSIEPTDIMKWWKNCIEKNYNNIRLVSFEIPIRPGYIPICANRRGSSIIDYEVRCPNPKCDLHISSFQEKEPGPKTYRWKKVHDLFASPENDKISIGIPIQCHTVDEKLYHYPPTLVVGTCDKIAITPSKADAASIFGRVRSYDPTHGYKQDYPEDVRASVSVKNFEPPNLIIQDELHLLDGPLGSIFGLYETALDILTEKPKYVASSATIRNSNQQVGSIMSREAQIFPPVNSDINDGFFLCIGEPHALDESGSGRLFFGVAAPGKAAQTPIVRIWSRLLQSTYEFINSGGSKKEADYFWTLVGYFNAIRELAGGEALWRQDIPDRIKEISKLVGTAGTTARDITEMTSFKNLSSQTDSSELPGILVSMEKTLMNGDSLNGVAATSMFGTGVDIDRLSLMVVHGQPKSASSYIQAVGRIGRKRAGLAVMFLRVARPRDLNHYEFFTGYHRRLSVAVEPISVKPLAPRAIERILGPLIVMLYRNAKKNTINLPRDLWKKTEGAKEILKLDDSAIDFVENMLREKWEAQPEDRRPPKLDELIDLVRSSINQWKDLASKSENDKNSLQYTDWTNNRGKAVLGPPSVSTGNYAYRNAPTSLREVEATIKINTRGT